MRLYHYTAAKHAISALRDKRLKVAELDDMNDPFELRSIRFQSAEYRVDSDKFLSEMTESTGFLCFSETWDNLLMWSHYCDNHRGVCLGFEIGSIDVDEKFTRVTYCNTIQPAPRVTELNQQKMVKLLTTKSLEWAYEREWRALPTVKDPEWDESLKRTLQFVGFGDLLALREALLSFRCSVADKDSIRALCRPEVTVRRLKLRDEMFGLH